MIGWLTLLLATSATAAAPPPVQAQAPAPVRVVTYLSFTCPHCAVHEAEVAEPLDRLVEAGAVVAETRYALRDPLDLIAATLADCRGPDAAAGDRRALFATQGAWMTGAQNWIEANRATLAALPADQVGMAVAEGAGLLGVLGARGLTKPAAAACLADPAERQRLVAATDEAWTTRAIPGTPYTLVDDQPVAAGDWPGLRTAIQSAIQVAASRPR